MSGGQDGEAGKPGAEIIQLHPAGADAFEPSDVSYEVELDDAPEPGPPVSVDMRAASIAFRPAIPEQWRTVKGMRIELDRHWRLLRHRTAVHGLRSPLYLIQALAWAVVGLFRVIARQLHWWWMLEQHSLRSGAAAAGDSREWMRLHKEAKETRKIRGFVLLAEVIAVAIGVAVLVHLGSWLIGAAVACVALPLLAHHGRPADKPIISPAVVQARFRKLSADIVLRAYYAAGLGHPDKPDQQVTFGSPMARDGEGSRVLVDLPYGKGLDDAVKAKGSIASGLDVTESQVFLHRDPTSHRRHTLWVADRDPLAVPVGRTPLLACKQTDIWKAAPLGLDERGQLVRIPLMWNSLLIGALPRQGKTFCARCLGLYCALDPFVKLHVFDAAGKPDWRHFSLVADTCAFGLTPTKNGLPPEIFRDTLAAIKDDVQDRYHRLSELADRRSDLCPEGKLTRAISRDPRYKMPVRVVLLDEFQEWFDLGDITKEIAALLVFLVKVAPGAGIILIDATQKPSGIGTGHVAQQFNSFRDQHQLRFSLRTSSWNVSELVLGAGAYSEGLDSSTLLPQYKGVGILRGADDNSPTVRTYLADGQDAEKILTAARTMRERTGTLSGMAAGEFRSRAARNVIADVLAVFAGEPGLWWEVVADRLAERFPDRWADATAEAISAQCRALGLVSVDVKMAGKALKGCRYADLKNLVQR